MSRSYTSAHELTSLTGETFVTSYRSLDIVSAAKALQNKTETQKESFNNFFNNLQPKESH